MPLEPGQALSHYRLIEKIGQGGMGVVWKALDTKLNRHVAIKLLPSDLTADSERRLRFHREAQAAAALDHPNIAVIHEVGEHEGCPFIAMQFLQGKSLRELVRQHPLPMKEWLGLALPVAEGLAHAHKHGIVHRDLKPDNVMITDEGQVKLLDFGLAKLLQPEHPAGASDKELATRLETISRELTRHGKVLGTVAYMSPEQARGEAVDHRSDLFSVGVMLYELASGKLPFKARSDVESLSITIAVEPKSLSEVAEGVPPEAERIVRKALEKEPDNRYQHADEMATDLKNLKRDLDSDRVSVPPWATAEGISHASPSGWAAESRRKWMLAGAGVVVLLALGLGAWWLGFLAPATPDERTMVVFPLKIRGQSDGADYLGQAFAEAMAIELAQAGDLDVLPVPEEGELGEKATGERVRAARDMGARLLLTGSVVRDGTSVEARVELVDAERNRILWGASADSVEGDLRMVVSSLTRDLMAHLNTSSRKLYDYPWNLTGSPEMAKSEDLAQVIGTLRVNDHRSARAPAQRLLEAFPGEVDAHVLFAFRLYMAWFAEPTPENRRDLERSVSTLERLDPDNPYGELFRAMLLEEGDNRPREAIELFSRFLRSA